MPKLKPRDPEQYKWALIEVDDWQHVYPINDLIGHVLSFENLCECNPVVDPINRIINHSSLDRREVWEKPDKP